jgi:hypothetical protein
MNVLFKGRFAAVFYCCRAELLVTWFAGTWLGASLGLVVGHVVRGISKLVALYSSSGSFHLVRRQVELTPFRFLLPTFSFYYNI